MRGRDRDGRDADLTALRIWVLAMAIIVAGELVFLVLNAG